MTICIAAICDNGGTGVVAADRMAVFGAGSLLEFKQDDSIHKVYKIGRSSVLLHSGATKDAEAVVDAMSKNSKSKEVRHHLDSVLAELLKRKRDAQTAGLIGSDYDFNKLLGLAGTVAPFNEIWQQVRKIDLGEMLLVTPEVGEVAIHYLRPPEFGTKSDLSYASIGSGGIYGRAALTIQQYSKSTRLTDATFQVYSAKKAAEMVYGVGEQTDMAVVTHHGVTEVPAETMSLLEEFRLQRSKFLVSEDQSKMLLSSMNIADETESSVNVLARQEKPRRRQSKSHKR
jgi:20S proteasome alpha/beta subunit